MRNINTFFLSIITVILLTIAQNAKAQLAISPSLNVWSTSSTTYTGCTSSSGIIKAKATVISSNTITFLIQRVDGGTFLSSGTTYVRVSTPCGSWLASGSYTIGNLTATLSCTFNISVGNSTTILLTTVSTSGGTCHSGTFTVTNPGCTGWACSPSSASLTSSGGNNSFTVSTTVGGCSFSAVSNNSWINSITYGIGGQVNYHVDANTGNSRTGTISIKDGSGNTQVTFTITQDAGNACTGWACSPSSASFTSSGGNNSFAVTTAVGGCSFSAVANNSWINSITYGIGGQVNYHVDANTGNSRTGTISIKDGSGNTQVTFTANQDAGSSCTIPANPLNPTSNSPACGSVIITRNGSVPPNQIYYWQGTSCGTSTSLGSGSTFTATSSGTYYIRAYNTVGGCWSTGCGSLNVTVNSAPSISINPPSATISSGSSVTLTASGATTYTWTPSTGLNTTTGATVTANPTSSTTYTITGTSSGCSSSGTVTVTVSSSCSITGQWYSQVNPLWKNHAMCTGYTIGGSGCAMSAVSILLATEISDITPVNPDILNSWMLDHDGYDETGGDCLIRWWVADDFDGSPSGLNYINNTTNTFSLLDAQLDQCNKVIVKVNGGAHWVVVIGRTGPSGTTNGSYYKVLDPGNTNYVAKTLANFNSTFSKGIAYSGVWGDFAYREDSLAAIPVDNAEVYPNPVLSNNLVEFNLQTDTSQSVIIRLIDLSGRVLLQQNSVLGEGENQGSFTAPSESGVYLLQFIFDDGTLITQKVIVQQ